MDREKAYFVNGGKFTKMEMVCKALQQCTMPSDSEGYETQCGDCPYFDPDCSVSVCKQQLCDDALALLKEQEHKDRMFHALEEDWKRLKEQPQIVRCKDCKHYRKSTRYPDTNLIMDYCAINMITGKDDNWFCADGERRIDDA